LVLWFARDRTLFHSLGAFSATFIFALFTLAWVDRGGSGTVPLLSSILVAIMIIVSMLLFARLVQRLSDLQITNVLQLTGDRGREVIREMFERREGKRDQQPLQTRIAQTPLGPIAQTLRYSGTPRAVASLNIPALVEQAQRADGVIVMKCAVGDTLVDRSLLLQVHGAKGPLSEKALMQSIRLGRERTFEQDPKYPIRLLVDVAIKALSPAINDPTTAVQTIDQIEDLLRRLGEHDLDAGYAGDASGVVRLVFPMPTWDDYLALSFDEIRQYGATSVQVMRRLRSALLGLMESLSSTVRIDAVRQYLAHLDLAIDHSTLDSRDREMAHQEDRQGLGLSRSAAANATPSANG
jgi:uncharacterized membrane protein